jgi:hypothetical protein
LKAFASTHPHPFTAGSFIAPGSLTRPVLPLYTCYGVILSRGYITWASLNDVNNWHISTHRVSCIQHSMQYFA